MVWMYYNEYILKNKKEIEYRLNRVKDKTVICLNTNEIFNRLSDATKKYKIKRPVYITECCNGKRKSMGKHPGTGEPLRWMYFDNNERVM